MVKVEPDAYLRSIRDYAMTWNTVDSALYRVCIENPGHTDRSGVLGKLWLIGRTYATGIERQIRSSGTQGSSMHQLANLLWQNSARVDDLLYSLNGMKEPLTPEMSRAIVLAHGELLRLITRITRQGVRPRSFVSKYLHFHQPVVPIYDSIASASLKGFVPWTNELLCFKLPHNADEEYTWFVARFLRLYDSMSETFETSTEFSVKLLDHYLLSQA